MKDSEQKVEQNRDVLACELFHLAARESELCFTILQYYKYQKHFHEYALKILDELVPELENEICTLNFEYFRSNFLATHQIYLCPFICNIYIYI